MQLIVLDDRCGGTLLQRGVHVVVTVESIAFNREEKLSRSNRARVDGISCDGITPGDLREQISVCADSRLGYPYICGRDKLGDFRERQLHAGALRVCAHSNPTPRKAPRATATSSKACDPSRVTCTFSCPLPASRTISPGRASAMASAIALRRSTSTRYFTPVFCSPTKASLMIARGSSLRGLSEVSTTK